jgi:pyruvate/2-oxoglutarate dehydrogenase complex dihydrolipoamide dehydrogenase (E3) component
MDSTSPNQLSTMHLHNLQKYLIIVKLTGKVGPSGSNTGCIMSKYTNHHQKIITKFNWKSSKEVYFLKKSLPYKSARGIYLNRYTDLNMKIQEIWKNKGT